MNTSYFKSQTLVLLKIFILKKKKKKPSYKTKTIRRERGPFQIVIESKDPLHPVTKLSPFVVEKQLHSILGTAKSVKILKNNTMLVECFTRQQSENLLKHKKFFQLDVNIYPHKTLNSSKGVVSFL